MQNLSGESEWLVADVTAERVVLEDEEGSTEWVLPAALLPDHVEEGDALKVLAEVVREGEEDVPGAGREASASREGRNPDAGDASGGTPRALEEATRNIVSGVLDSYEPGDADPVEG